MNSIHRLREVLSRALTSPEICRNEQDLFDELMVQKSRLLRLFEVGLRNPQEQREIETGKLILNNKTTAVNADFARQAIFLSQQLNCSEKYIASILYDVMVKNPNTGPNFCLEKSISDFHQRRRDLVDCLRFLLDATEAAEVPDAPPTYKLIAKFVTSELLPGTKTPTGDVTLASKLFKEIEQLEVEIRKADNARKDAGSNTQGQTLGSDILSTRYESLKYERRCIGIISCSISRLGYLGVNEIRWIVDWLSLNSNHPMTYYLLTAVLLSFDPIDPLDTLTSKRHTLAIDHTLITFLTKKFEPSTVWSDTGLKATLQLKWAMFLTEARHNDATLEHKTGFKTEELETQVWNAVQNSAFTYLAHSVVHLRKKADKGPAAVVLEKYPLEHPDLREQPPAEFKSTILIAYETLVRSLITHASSELRKIKQRQEDLILANARTDWSRQASRFPSTLPPEQESALRHDIAVLYTFIGLLYAALPQERALQFWGAGSSQPPSQTTYQEKFESTSGRLPAFLQWAVWSTPIQDSTMLSSLYDMLCGLAHGQQCSELAYNFLARGGGEVLPDSLLTSSSSTAPTISWVSIFGKLESWAANAANPQPQAKSHIGTSLSGPLQHLATSSAQKFMLASSDIYLARSFLRLLATVAEYSIAVRTTIASHGHFRAIPILLSLIPLSVPLELKGAIFEAVAAFCEPGAGIPGTEICKAVWTLMERLEVINVRMAGSAGINMSLAAGKGVEVELEQVETAHHVYPATLPFLKLISTLIHTPKEVHLQDRALGTEPINTIPENLGQPYRLPGISPFTSFVIDNVFANIPNREYSCPSDRWQTNDLCLSFIERSLASFSLESLLTGPDDTSPKPESLTPFLIHPGYDVLRRLLTNTPLQATILSYIVEGIGGLEKGFADEEPFFRSTIVRVLRIVYRVLEIQEIFLDVFITLLSDTKNGSSLVGHVHSRSFFNRFDQVLSFGVQHIPAIASYISYHSHPELVLLSIRIIAKLSLSVPPSTLVTLVQRCPDSDRILAGFTRIMSSDSSDDVVQAEECAEQMTGAGASIVESSPESLEQAVRLAALDLVIQDTEGFRPYPNITHFLLFGGEQTFQDPRALGAQQTSIHVLLDLVNVGVPRIRGRRNEKAMQELPLFVTLPELAERCYKVIHQLCMHPKTSDFTTRYLRTREDFFARQIAKVPSAAPESLQDPAIQVVYNDGSRVTATVVSLSAFLRLRSYIFDLVALELHLLTNKGHHKVVSELLEILFGTDVEYEEEHGFPVFHDLGQSPIRVIDFLQSLMFDWSDSLFVTPTTLEHLKQVDFQSCIRKDASGCNVIDRTALLSLLASVRRVLHTQGHVATQAQHDKLASEMTYILESCAVENHRRKVTHARINSFQSWRRMLDLALTKCFTRLPHDRRENMLFDLLHVLPAAMRTANNEESTCVLISEVILSSITKLREDRQQQLILQSMGGDSEAGSLPAERLYSILRNILEGILDNNHVELVRGNLYAALINLLNLIRSSPEAKTSPSSEIDSNPFALSLVTSSLRGTIALDTRRSPSVAQSLPSEKLAGTGTPLELGCLAVMKPTMERLIATIARDAIDGTEVWKSVAFMLLDAIVQLSSLEKQHIILSALNKHGILMNFIRGIRDSDARLQAVLRPDPDDLNALYVYEAKMSLLVRMAQTRAGAERLLDAQLLIILSQCDFLDARPETDQSFVDQDSFLPSAMQRYHQLFMPVMQLLDGILSTLGNKHATVSHQALEFLANHGTTIAILLKNEVDYVTLPIVEEIYLIVSLCTNILPSIPKAELLSGNSVFGAVHLAILGLSARCIALGKPFVQIVPHTEVETKLSQQYAPGYGSRTKFDVRVKEQADLLRKALVLYIGVSSDFTESEISLVLSPTTTMPRNELHFTGTIPTIGDALIALDDLSNDLSTILKQISDINAELANKDHIGLENAQQILHEMDPLLLHTLDLDQKRRFLAQALASIQIPTRVSAKVILNTLEMLLLLLWRHLEYYTDESHMGAPPVKTIIGTAMRLLAIAEPKVFQKEVASKIGGTLARLDVIELDKQTFGHDCQDDQEYIHIMCRRLKSCAGIHDESQMVENC